MKVKRVKRNQTMRVRVRFLNAPQKQYTYLVPKNAKVALGSELVVHNHMGTSIVVVTELDPECDFPLDQLKTIRHRVARL